MTKQECIKDPYALLKEAGLSKKEWPEEANKILSAYDTALEMRKEYPDDPNMQKTAETTLKKVNQAITKMIKEYQDHSKSSKDQEVKNKLDEENSAMTMADIEKSLGELEACRLEINSLNKKKRELTGKPRTAKTTYTKLKEKLLSLISLMPNKIKEDAKAIKETQRILNVTHKELAKAWGMNKLDTERIKNALTEKFENLKEKAEES